MNLWKYLPKRGFSILISNHFKAISKSHMAKFSNINLIVKSKGYVLGKFLENWVCFLFSFNNFIFIKYKDDINFLRHFILFPKGLFMVCRLGKIDL